METLGLILVIIGGIGSLVCWIWVLIKMFQDSVLSGIVGIICSIWAFIWGWINVGKFDLRNVMIIWSVCIVLSIIGSAMGGVPAGGY